jgi:phage tail-like protein
MVTLRRKRVSRSAIAVLLAGGCLVTVAASDGIQKGGPVVNQFKVEIDGIASGFFTNVSGLGVVNETTEVREGGSNDVRLLPGRTKFPLLELKRRATGARDLYDWTVSNLAGKLVRRTVVVSMLDAKATAVAKWTFKGAWPVKWEGPDFDASKNEVAIETIYLAYEGVTMTSEIK